jgi:hypothetical protein
VIEITMEPVPLVARVRCDQCGQWVEDESMALFVYPNGPAGSLPGPVAFLHKRECDKLWQANHPLPEGFRWYWRPPGKVLAECLVTMRQRVSRQKAERGVHSDLADAWNFLKEEFTS